MDKWIHCLSRYPQAGPNAIHISGFDYMNMSVFSRVPGL